MSSLWQITVCWVLGAGSLFLAGSAWSQPMAYGDEHEHRIEIIAVGDLLFHSPLQTQAYSHEAGFRSLWWRVEDLIKSADIAFANLEGPLSGGALPKAWHAQNRFSGYPRFNAHRMAALSIAASGFDIVSFSNNHTFDRGYTGVERTVNAVAEAGLSVVGVGLATDQALPVPTIVHLSGKNIAWFSCTYGLNVPLNDPPMVTYCFDDAEKLLQQIRIHANRQDIDTVIVAPHWGAEYRTSPSQRQRRLAHQFIHAGASAVIGAHSHVLGPVEMVCRSPLECGVIAYSLGNFVSNQQGILKATSILLVVELTFNPAFTTVNRVGAIPITVSRTQGEGTI